MSATPTSTFVHSHPAGRGDWRDVAYLDLLACPQCAVPDAPLAIIDTGMRCAAGHNFDVPKAGYIPLLGGAGITTNPDDAAMIAARTRVLESGAYEPIAAALVAALPRNLHAPEQSPAIVDVGAGEGYYTAAIAQAALAARVIGTDLSKPGLKALRKLDVALPVLANAWARWPLRTGAIDVVTTVFAPRNPAETARVLRPGGLLLVITPEPGHLANLPQGLSTLAVAPGKAEQLTDAYPGLEVISRAGIDFEFAADAALLADLVLMGPAAHHRSADAVRAAANQVGGAVPVRGVVTLSVLGRVE